MLRFCFEELTRSSVSDPGLENLLIEGFLLHYRNLIRFISGRHARGDDLTIERGDLLGAPARAAQVQALALTGAHLDDKYHDQISKYLQHCTTRRFDVPQNWDIKQMYSEIGPALQEFEQLYPPTAQVSVVISDEGAHTATMTRYRL